MRQRVTSAPSKMMFYTTSARKDPSLARNRFKRFGGGGVSDVRSDYGTTRNNQDSSRDRAADDDHPHIVTIGTEGNETGGEVADIVDEIGDAILEANESMWQLIFHNDVVAKVIFPVEGNGEVEGDGDDDSLEDGGIRQATSVDYFMNCTQTTFDGSAVEMTNSMHEAAAPTSDAPKKKSGGMKLMMRRKKTKSNNGQDSTKVLDAIAEGGGELGGVAETRQEDGVSVASSAGSDGLVRESMALLTIYNKSIDADEEEEEQEQEVNEKEQKQEEQEEGVEAVTAIALCGDETTVISSDQQEVTLQEYSSGAVGAFAPVGDENTIVPSDQQELTLQEFTGEKALATKKKKLLDVNAILCQNPEHVLDDDYTTGLTSDASSTSSSSPTIVTEKASLKDGGGGNGSVSRKSMSSKKGGGAVEDTFEPEKVLVGVPTLDMTMTSFDMSQKNDDAISTISMQTDLKSRADNTGGLGYGRSLLNALTGYTGENLEGESRVTEEETTFNATTFDGSIGTGPPMNIEESYTDGTEETGPIGSRCACLG